MFAITGTPGVGKTTVAEILESRGYSVGSVNEVAEYYGCIEKKDDVNEVDVEMLKKLFKHEDFEFDFIEGHLSHHLCERCAVLRCRPDILEKRMREKGWGKEKIMKNIEAEIIDYILTEAVETCNDVHEIDTTFLTPNEVANVLERIFKGEVSFPPGNVDWIGELGNGIYRYLRM